MGKPTLDQILDKLAESVIHNNAVFFVDISLPLTPGQPPAYEPLIKDIAKHLGSSKYNGFSALVDEQYFESGNLNETIRLMREWNRQIINQPAPNYERLAEIVADRQTKIITTHPGRILDRYLDKNIKGCKVISNDKGVTYQDESKITLIKLLGDFESSNEDHKNKNFFRDRFRKWRSLSDNENTPLSPLFVLATALFSTKTIIYLGADFDGPIKFIQEYLEQKFGPHACEIYGVVTPIHNNKAVDLRIIRDRGNLNGHVGLNSHADFLSKLARVINRKQAAKTVVTETDLSPETLPKMPYKELLSFGTADSTIFAGREKEAAELTSRILVQRLTVLYGESGSGKTSLLQAGIGTLLKKDNALLTIVKVSSDRSLGTGLMVALDNYQWPNKPQIDFLKEVETKEVETVSCYLRSWQESLEQQAMVIAFDQFEQLFLTDSIKEKNKTLLRCLLNDTSLKNIRFVFSIREDFLHELDQLSPDIADPLRNRYRLERFGYEDAKQAITKPAEKYPFSWEKSLVNTLVNELKGEQDKVYLPHLQIVCTHLYNKFVAPYLGNSQVNSVKIKLDSLEASDQVHTILSNFLKKSVVSVTDEILTVGKEDLIWELLGEFVDQQGGGIKRRRMLSDLQKLDLPLSSSRLDSSRRLNKILGALTDERILQRYTINNSSQADEHLVPAYELTHDFLAKRLIDQLPPEYWARQAAGDIVRKRTDEWEKVRPSKKSEKEAQSFNLYEYAAGWQLSSGELRLVESYKKRLRISAAEAEMIYASTVVNRDATTDNKLFEWDNYISRIRQYSILLWLLDSSDGDGQKRAADQLGRFTWNEDLEEQVQQKVEDLAQKTIKPDGKTAAAAQQALVTISDQVLHIKPFRIKSLPFVSRLSIMREVWANRWSRYQINIRGAAIKGGVGGLLGGAAFAGLFWDNDFIHNRLPFETILFWFTVAGVIGGAAIGMSAFSRATIRGVIYANTWSWGDWLITVLGGACLITAGWLIALDVFATGNNAQGSSALAGIFLLGLGLLASAAWASRHKTLLSSVFIAFSGPLLFGLTGYWIFERNIQALWWLLPFGLVASTSFSWGLDVEIDDKKEDRTISLLYG